MNRLKLGQRYFVALSLILVGSLASPLLHAQAYEADKPMGMAAQQTPAYLAHAGIEQRLGQPLPMAALFTDETGRTGPLSSWFSNKPVVMAEVYYQCAMMCPQVQHGLATGLAQTTLKPGQDYQVLVVSIDTMDKPANAVDEKKTFLSEAGWTNNPTAANAVHFLTADQPSIDAITNATGFHYVRVPGPDGKMDQFAHSSVIMFATPDGRMSRYLSGIDYPARDLRMALLQAGDKKISNPVDLLILYCCNYSPAVGRYSVSIVRILGIAGMITMVLVAAMIFLLTRKPKGLTASVAGHSTRL
ncbi:MAG: SCO family protein [Acidobacteriaceae bacterium]